MTDPTLNLLLIAGVLLVVPALAAWLLKRAGCPGWHVVGGAAAGIVLGPTIFGGLAPQTFESIFVGGSAQHERLEEIRHRRDAHAFAADEAGPDHDVPEQAQQQYETELAEARQSWRDAKWAHQRPLRVFIAALAAAVLLTSGLLAVPRQSNGTGWITPISIGLWSAALPGGLGFAAAYYWFEHELVAALIASGAVAIGPWTLTAIDRQAADHAEHGGARTIQNAGRAASIIALLVAAWALWRHGQSHSLVWFIPLAALPIGWALPALQPAAVRNVALFVLIPALTAAVALRINVYQHITLWALIVFVILSGDGRWLGAYIGTMTLGGRRSLRSMRLVLGSMACGPTQLAVTAIALHVWLIPETLGLALLAGAILIEITTPMRRRMATELTEAEAEIEELEDQL